MYQVSSTNIGAIVTVHFNVASFEANLGDWGWVLAGVDPAFDVQDANAFINDSGSGAVYTRFSEGCWFYFGQAAVLSKPFLCSRDPDAELSALQSSTLNEPYQYGSLEFYSAASGNLSIWYAFDEQFDFAMVQSYFTCGIDLVAPESLVVRNLSGRRLSIQCNGTHVYFWSHPFICCKHVPPPAALTVFKKDILFPTFLVCLGSNSDSLTENNHCCRHR